jgi:hypothetical protein
MELLWLVLSLLAVDLAALLFAADTRPGLQHSSRPRLGLAHAPRWSNRHVPRWPSRRANKG